MNHGFALKILRTPEKERLEKYSKEEIIEANRTCEIVNSLHICPMCKSRMVTYVQKQLGGCQPCLHWKSGHESHKRIQEQYKKLGVKP